MGLSVWPEHRHSALILMILLRSAWQSQSVWQVGRRAGVRVRVRVHARSYACSAHGRIGRCLPGIVAACHGFAWKRPLSH